MPFVEDAFASIAQQLLMEQQARAAQANYVEMMRRSEQSPVATEAQRGLVIEGRARRVPSSKEMVHG